MKKHVLWWVATWTVFLSPFIEQFASAAGGSVFAWGYNSFGECNVPPGLTDTVDLACGNYFSMALRANGTLVTWGNDAFGLREVPPTATGVVAISSRGYCALALPQHWPQVMPLDKSPRSCNTGGRVGRTADCRSVGEQARLDALDQPFDLRCATGSRGFSPGFLSVDQLA